MKTGFWIGLTAAGLLLMFGAFVIYSNGLNILLSGNDVDGWEQINQARAIAGVGFSLFSFGLILSLVKLIK